MPPFYGHTHTRRTRFGISTSDSRTAVLEPEPEVNERAEEPSVPTHQQIAELAYSYWEARGSRHGSAWDDWFRAERELARRNRAR